MRVGKSIEAEGKFVAVRGPEEQRMGRDHMSTEFLFGMMGMFWNRW